MKLMILSLAILTNFFLNNPSRLYNPARLVVIANFKILSAFPPFFLLRSQTDSSGRVVSKAAQPPLISAKGKL